MSYQREARTMFASKALAMSEMFTLKFGRRAIPGAVSRGVRIDEPEESTAGGKQAREPIVMFEAGNDAGATLVVGWVDVAEEQAELRTFEVAAAIYQRRTGKAFDVPQGEYSSLVEEMRQFFSEEQIPTRMLAQAPPESAGASAPAPPPGPVASAQGAVAHSGGVSTGMVLGIAIGVAVLGVVVGIVVGKFL